MSQMTGDLTITTYVNLFEDNCGQVYQSVENGDIGRFAQYIRFKPDIKMKYVYYYDRTYNHAALQQRYPGLSDEEDRGKIVRNDESESQDVYETGRIS